MKLFVHKLGANTYGEDVTSCVLEKLAAPDADDFYDQYSDGEQAVINVLESYCPLRIMWHNREPLGKGPAGFRFILFIRGKPCLDRNT